MIERKRVLPPISANQENWVRIDIEVYNHFTKNYITPINPAKSIFSALCYSLFLGALTQEKPIDLLTDPELLLGDIYYQPYKKDYKIDWLNYDKNDKIQNAYRCLIKTNFLEMLKPYWFVSTVGPTFSYFCAEFKLSDSEIKIVKDKLFNLPTYNYEELEFK